jgi:hypothetical protein
MFHGEALLPRGRSGEASHEPGENAHECMKLRVNAYSLSDVIIPERSTNIVVGERIAHELRNLGPNLDLRPVIMNKVVNLPWHFDKTCDYGDVINNCVASGHDMKIYDMCEHDSMAAVALPCYYEVIAYNYYTVAKNYNMTGKFFIANYKSNPLEHDVLGVCKEMFCDYPVINPSLPIIRNDVYDIIFSRTNAYGFGIKEYLL